MSAGVARSWSGDDALDVAIVRALLGAHPERVSGEALGRTLGVSRAGIAARVARLRRLGFDVSGRTRGGYLLRAEPDLPCAPRVLPHLGSRWLGRRWLHVAELGSTNDRAGEEARAGAPSGLVVCAESQTRGRGRLGRSWYAPAGDALTFSVVWRPELPPARVAPVTLLAGAAIAETLTRRLGVAARVKWPNDVVVDAGGGTLKVAGVLTEMATEQERVRHVVVGIGLNVNVLAFPPELAARATSLRRVLGAHVPRVPLLIAVLERLEAQLDDLLASGPESGLAAFRALADFGRRHRVEVGSGRSLEGVAFDIAADGALLLRDDAGTVHRIASGELGEVGA